MRIGIPGRRSGNLEDRRGQRSFGGGGGIPLPIGALGGLGLPGILILLAIFFIGPCLTGGGGGGFDINQPFNGFPGVGPATGVQPLPGAPEEEDTVNFVSFVLDDIQASWETQFAEAGQTYEPAKLVLFTSGTQSGCGPASAATGPFYCTIDQTVYLDLAFFNELARRFDAPGDFAQAYVIAHEVAHHVQFLTGVHDEVRSQTSSNPDDANELSVRMELQADCLAGVWGHSTYERGILESGDLEEGLNAASAIGDDRIQQQTSGHVNPESFTHGSSEQRRAWFERGFDSGDPSQCDTFGGDI